jgi:hypothetical protein
VPRRWEGAAIGIVVMGERFAHEWCVTQFDLRIEQRRCDTVWSSTMEFARICHKINRAAAKIKLQRQEAHFCRCQANL